MEELVLNRLMKERHLNVRRLAFAADVPYSTLYDVSVGKRPVSSMSAGYVAAVADVLGISSEELLGLQPPMLSADEAELIGLWRQMPPMGKRMVIVVARQIVQEATEDGED